MKLKVSLFFVIASLFLFSQNKNVNNAIKYRISENDISIHTILVKGNIEKIKSQQNNYNYKFNYSAGNIASITTNLSVLSQLIENKIIV